jgi:hypothetical protein
MLKDNKGLEDGGAKLIEFVQDQLLTKDALIKEFLNGKDSALKAGATTALPSYTPHPLTRSANGSGAAATQDVQKIIEALQAKPPHSLEESLKITRRSTDLLIGQGVNTQADYDALVALVALESHMQMIIARAATTALTPASYQPKQFIPNAQKVNDLNELTELRNLLQINVRQVKEYNALGNQNDLVFFNEQLCFLKEVIKQGIDRLIEKNQEAGNLAFLEDVNQQIAKIELLILN